MKQTEKEISHFVETQFPTFYAEEGPQFIAFIKAYYEWMETEDQPIYESRRLGEYRDIDETMEEFILFFKEKYLKNIQFDTATNKTLLVKNSLDLYRSKGSERSIDLFFKLVYGTDADVSYPADNIIRPSDGVWEKPLYLEVSYSKFNIDYVGRQVVGSESNATAFVERYIRRKTNRGYVNLLYVSEVNGEFKTGEIVGLNINSVPVIDLDKRARLFGSIDSIIMQDRGQGFSVGDLITFDSDSRGLGGQGRVEAIESATGVIDFALLESGFGYTFSSEAIISEKVVSAADIIPDPTSKITFKVFENIVEPLANITFETATANLVIGDTISRWSAGSKVAESVIIDIDQLSGTEGTMTVSHRYGALTTGTYFSVSNSISISANTVDDRTIQGTIMGIPRTYTLSLNNQSGTVFVGDNVVQSNTSDVIATGTISDITETTTGNVVVVENVTGSFKLTEDAANFFYTSGVGTVTSYTSNNFILGGSTNFTNDYVDAVLYDDSNNAIGEVLNVINTTAMELKTNGLIAASANDHSYGLRYQVHSENGGLSANITNISSTVGLYEIQKESTTFTYSSASGSNVVDTSYIYQYDSLDRQSARAKVIIGDYTAGSGNLIVTLIEGYFEEGLPIYTDANAASADLNSVDINISGGDFIASSSAKMYTYNTNTEMSVDSLSFGSGASFDIGSLGDTETIFIGTDVLAANNAEALNFQRQTLSVGSNTGFSINDYVYQQINRIAFNPSTDFDETGGVITLPTANSRYVSGDIVRYEVAGGNTSITGFSNNQQFHVITSNTTTITLGPIYDRFTTFSTAELSPDIGTTKSNEVGHYIYKVAGGKIFELGTGIIRAQDVYNDFGVAAVGGNTTVYANTNVQIYQNATVNTNISAVTQYSSVVQQVKPYMALSLTEDAYGFPKNTGGNLKDVIYNCLTFADFTLGSIGTISGIDPGSEYNVDPYVVVYEPAIASLGRKDFVIEIEDTTSSFVVGEVINQTSSNLIFFDLQVDSGVFSNTYIEQTITFNSDLNVDSANDFIYAEDSVLSFNANTSIDNANDFITIPDNTLVDGELVRYYTAAGNTVIVGLSNNEYYFVTSSNTSGIQLSATFSGANIDMTASATDESGHFIVNHDNNLSDGDTVLYSFPIGNTAISGLANNTLYYVTDSNTSGFALATAAGGANVDITSNSTGGETHSIVTVPGYLPNERLYQAVLSGFNSNTGVDNVNDFISISPQPYADGDAVTYYTSTGNTSVVGLSNNSVYYIVGANSTGVQLAASPGGANLDISATVTSETGHNILSVANASVNFVFTDGANSFVRVSGTENTLANNYQLYSYTNEYVNGLVSNVATVQIVSTATGVVKAGSNTSTIYVKRLSYENTFQSGLNVVGSVSGANAVIVTVAEDEDTLFPIGLNANVSANVVTADGQISSLQVIDSGFGFSNNELVQFISNDGVTGGTIRLIKGGLGQGRGFYRSTKGFLSEDMFVHDGDFYQEYSYEILSKISFDKYCDMFNKVMHVAGTKFFGSVRIIENANVTLTLSESSVAQANTI